MRRVLSVFYQHMPPFPGGAALRGGSVVDALEAVVGARGYHIRVVTAAGQPRETPMVRVEALHASDVDNAAGLVHRLGGELLLGWRVGLRILRARPTAALISTPAYLAAGVASLLCRIARIPYLLEVRDIYPQVYLHAGLVRASSPFYRFLLGRSRSLYRRAARVVAVTAGLRASVEAESGRRDVACVYNGFPASLRQHRPPKHARFTVCFHGVLGFFQDIETLSALASALEPHAVDVVVIGYGHKEPLLSTGPANLRFLGRLPFEQTIDEVARCHVGLCLRRADEISRDAFPIKVWEYLGLGMPTLVTPVCEAGDFVQRHGCGAQFAAGDVDALLTAVLALRDDPLRLGAIAKRCETHSRAYTREQLAMALAGWVDDHLKSIENAPHDAPREQTP